MNNDATTVGSALEQLRTTAPPTVLPRVLAATGLADRYTTITGPTGPLYVAWSDQGVSAVAPAADDREFEDTYAARVGRSAVRDDAIPQRLANGSCLGGAKVLFVLEDSKIVYAPTCLERGEGGAADVADPGCLTLWIG